MARRTTITALLLTLLGSGLSAQTATHTTAPSTTRYVLADSNEARYIVQERLAGLDFPNDAVGRTSAITGGITLDANGKVVPSASHFVVDLGTLKSDKANRDRYLKTKTLETDKFPRAELAVTDLQGFPATLPDTGTFTFQLVGTLALHGFSRHTTWQVTATAHHGTYRGTASTEFKFADFGMDVPRAFVVLSVEDHIKLEYEFTLRRDTPASH